MAEQDFLETALYHISNLDERGLTPHGRAKAITFYTLARESPGPVVELGAYRGIGTIALAYGTQAGCGFAVYAVDDYGGRPNHVGSRDGNEHDRALIGPNLAASKVRPWVRLVNGAFVQIAKGWEVPAGLVLWDGGTREGLREAFDAWAPHVLPCGYFAFRSIDDDGLGCVPILQAAVDGGGWQDVQGWPSYIWSVQRSL